MLEPEIQIIFVTIGVPFSNVPIMQKVMLVVKEDSNRLKTAKALRKWVADNIEDHGWIPGTKFKPSELYFEIFRDADDDIPFSMSFNSRFRREHINGRAAQSATNE